MCVAEGRGGIGTMVEFDFNDFKIKVAVVETFA